jgi:hypothetical protein
MSRIVTSQRAGVHPVLGERTLYKEARRRSQNRGTRWSHVATPRIVAPASRSAASALLRPLARPIPMFEFRNSSNFQRVKCDGRADNSPQLPHSNINSRPLISTQIPTPLWFAVRACKSVRSARIKHACLATSMCALLSACGGGGNSASPVSGAGQSQSLTWDSGDWDNTTWS